jgi:hypothetical protein
MSAARPARVWSNRLAGWLVPANSRRTAPARPRIDLVGRDFVQRRAALPSLSRALAALLVAIVLAALALAALRVDLIRVRYGLGVAMREEKALLEQERVLRARLGSLRDPIRLARLAPRYGLERTTRVLILPAAGAADRRP